MMLRLLLNNFSMYGAEKMKMSYWEKLFHTCAIVWGSALILGLLGCNPAIAGGNSFTTTGELIRKEPIFTQVQKRHPYQECYTVDVPIYGNAQGGGASAGDVLGGMIIGGLIGKGVTNKDNGAAAGAVLGGMIAADKKKNKQTIVGYKQENRCETKYRSEFEQVVNQYRLVYRVDGHEFAYNVNRAQGESAWIGQRKQFRIRYQMLN